MYGLVTYISVKFSEKRKKKVIEKFKDAGHGRIRSMKAWLW